MLNRYKLQRSDFQQELSNRLPTTVLNAPYTKSLPTRKRREAEPKHAYTEAATYQYNDEGIRTVKVVNGIRHEYDVVGGQINREVIRSSSSATSAVMKDIRVLVTWYGNTDLHPIENDGVDPVALAQFKKDSGWVY